METGSLTEILESTVAVRRGLEALQGEHELLLEQVGVVNTGEDHGKTEKLDIVCLVANNVPWNYFLIHLQESVLSMNHDSYYTRVLKFHEFHSEPCTHIQELLP